MNVGLSAKGAHRKPHKKSLKFNQYALYYVVILYELHMYSHAQYYFSNFFLHDWDLFQRETKDQLF